MGEHYDGKETRRPEERERALFAALPGMIAGLLAAPAWARRLDGVDPAAVTSPEALAGLPVLRKSELMEAQRDAPPFGGFVAAPTATLARVFVSPGPVFVPQGTESDAWGAARALHAAGVRPGDLAVNTFGYHVTPGAFILESGLAALGCPVFAAGPGRPEEVVPLLAALRPSVYCGVPDFLNILLDRAEAAAADLSSLRAALVSGAALPGDLRQRIEARGVHVAQCYATADLGVIAYESRAREGLIVNEDVILEIVRPGTGDPVAEGEVGEVVVTRLCEGYPLLRFATGDLSAILPGESPCGRTNRRIRGWMGRADQRTKVKGMFVDPAQIAEVRRRHPEIVRARLVVSRADHVDQMVLMVEAPAAAEAAIGATLKAVTNLSGSVEAVPEGALPNDGKVIADERPVEG
ncbi:phenylacetate--CoA ligase family protein [Acuticoccus mangrovi]|uniref:AMP-binding protein n=1 Tax=Acuticoccus mangrovi TaxID=2796142 RepID=A0A934MGX2_9HYPH|nr:AMP-binding protein [Acuticoccus mangrovi]MBJ3776350.1 AMP-binding protein [Acuticoccus mangrovi]